MTFFLRNDKNRTIFSLDFWSSSHHESDNEKRFHELSASVDIINYSNFLLENPNRKHKIIDTFHKLSEYRGWLWESYYMVKKNTGDKKEGDKIMRLITIDLKDIAKEFGLYYVTD